MRRPIVSIRVLVLGLLALGATPLPVLARLSVHPNAYAMETPAEMVTTAPLHITNLGPASPLGYTVSDDRDWMSEYPTAGQIVMGDTVTVTVTFDASGLAPDTYSGTITVVDPHHGPLTIQVTFTVTPVAGVGNEWVALPSGIALSQSRPNPMRGTADLRFRLAQKTEARLSIFDPAGREVARLVDGTAGAGEARVIWDGAGLAGEGLPAGVYFYRLETPIGTLSRRLIILR